LLNITTASAGAFVLVGGPFPDAKTILTWIVHLKISYTPKELSTANAPASVLQQPQFLVLKILQTGEARQSPRYAILPPYRVNSQHRLRNKIQHCSYATNKTLPIAQNNIGKNRRSLHGKLCLYP
jgi:hypothetical protein